MRIRLPTASSGPLSLALLCMPAIAQAHVKWFCGPIDASAPPVALAQVVTPFFVALFALFALLVAGGAMADALVARFTRTPLMDPVRAARVSDVLVRLGVAAYALCLWGDLAVVEWAAPSSGSVLTPDLYGASDLVGYLQFGIAIAVLVPRLSVFAAVGLVALYAIGVVTFGPFYMIDYLFFPGLAAYVALSAPALGRLSLARHRVPILIGALSLSLMWTAVEKFLYPQWTIAVLLRHPGVTAGLPFPTVTTVAGFVEFSLAFYLMAGREILGRIGAVLFAFVFIAAMPEFGMLDIVGHIPVLLILAIGLITGETPLQMWFRGPSAAALASGWRVARGYVAALVVLMALYYAAQALSVMG